MSFGPIARILVRYAVGTVIGSQAVEVILTDPDVMHVITISIAAITGIATEWAYKEARKRGWAT